MAKTMANSKRTEMRAFKNAHDSKATAAGMAAKLKPAAKAEVMLTPYNMKIEKRKLPMKLSQNNQRRSTGLSGGSLRAGCNQGHIASAAIANRSQASKNTGKTATRALDKPT